MKKITQENNYNFFFKKAHPSLYRKKTKKTPKHTLFSPFLWVTSIKQEKKSCAILFVF